MASKPCLFLSSNLFFFFFGITKKCFVFIFFLQKKESAHTNTIIMTATNVPLATMIKILRL